MICAPSKSMNFYDLRMHSTGKEMSLFVMGSASHVGKSITVAAICRCLVRRGFTVAPFKSQNMSLNSYVTPDGGEIGMAHQSREQELPAKLNGSHQNQLALHTNHQG